MNKKEQLDIFGYEISDDQDFIRKLYPIPHELENQLEYIYKQALKGKKSMIKKLTRLIEKYPRVPALKNYLSVLYMNLNQEEKSYEVNHWIIAEHPEYFYGKINMAAEYLLNEEYDKIPEVLGENMEIKKLYPERNIFHFSEVTAFFKIAILYYCKIGDLEQAELRLNILKEIAPDSEEFEISEENVNYVKREAFLSRKQIELEKSIDVEVNKTALTDIKMPPVFNHKATSLLYEWDFSFDKNLIDHILSLPRQSLIEDLNKVLEDSIIRFNYFKLKAEKDEFNEKNHSFVIHALLILSEIKATESLGNILDVLRQEEDYMDLFLGDVLTEKMWQILYRIVASDLDACKQFMFESGIYTFSKTAVSSMAVQVALNQDKRKDEIIEWFRDVLRFFLNADLKDNVIDSLLLGLLVNDVLDFKGKVLMSEIEELYKKDIVSLDSCGDLEDVRKHFANDENFDYKKNIESIFYIYEEIESWYTKLDDSDFSTNFERDEGGFQDDQSFNVFLKTGRNVPCPCGSGKKYKKCCLGKEER